MSSREAPVSPSSSPASMADARASRAARAGVVALSSTDSFGNMAGLSAPAHGNRSPSSASMDLDSEMGAGAAAEGDNNEYGIGLGFSPDALAVPDPGQEHAAEFDAVTANIWAAAQAQVARDRQSGLAGGGGSVSSAASQVGQAVGGGGGDGLDVAVDEEGVPIEDPYAGFQSRMFRAQRSVVHPKNVPITKLFVQLTREMIEDMVPARAMRINFPVEMFLRNAANIRDFKMPAKDGIARVYATSALLGALFAGMSMGFPSGNHAERQRAENANDNENDSASGRKQKTPVLHDVTRYMYIPESNPDEELPMFRIFYEEIRDKDDAEVTFIGIWLMVFDPTHSTSELLSKVMQTNSMFVRAQGACSQAPPNRNKSFVAETERRKRAGMSVQDLNNNFEQTTGMQHARIFNMESYFNMLMMHAGGSVKRKGKLFVGDIEQHMNTPRGRQELRGDLANGHGSFHPLAPEFVFNAKRAESLSYGVINLDGTPGNVHPKYLNPDSYWQDDVFQLPQNGVMFMCTSPERVTVFDLPLPRPVQNQVVPGDALMYLFKECMAEQPSQEAVGGNNFGNPFDAMDEAAEDVANAMQAASMDQGDDDEDDEDDDEEGRGRRPRREPITMQDYEHFRSVSTGWDESQRRDELLAKSLLQKYDFMTDVFKASLASGDTSVSQSAADGVYRIQTEKMTDRVGNEVTCIFNRVIQPWITRKKREFEDRRSQLEYDGVEDEREFEKIDKEEKKVMRRLYLVRKDLTEYYLHMLLECFHSTRDRPTLPNGYKAMVAALEELVEQNGGVASMAFPPNRPGRQITGSDHTAWHELQELLNIIFSKDALIEGRDVHIMHEMYLQSFDVYGSVRFVLIICSERGKGKSVRTKRMSRLLPKGFMAEQGASSARAGMNGNQSANNGCMIIFDEMTKDLTPAEVDERIEFWKQTLSNGKYTIERSCRAQKADGTDSYVTCEIVTDHSVAYCICTNHGPCFTPGNQEPDSGKHAMINRTVCLFARGEATSPSSESDFERNLQSPQIMERVKDFRLFTCLTAFCKMALRNCPWLRPDMSFAKKLWAEWDRILAEEYGMPRPEPRRNERRANICETQALMEAVARVYLFKQTAVNYEAGKPVKGTNVAPKFSIAHLRDVLRAAAVPSRDVIFDAWIKSLTYSIATSPHGINTMTSVCHLAGVNIESVFKQLPKDVIGADSDRTEAQHLYAVLRGKGAPTDNLERMAFRMKENRKLRYEWRMMASTSNLADMSVIEAINEVAKHCTPQRKLRYCDALMPTLMHAQIHYGMNDVLQWISGLSTDAVALQTSKVSYRQSNPKSAQNNAQGGGSGGGAQTYDHAWLVVHGSGEENVKFDSVVKMLRGASKGVTPVNLLDYHYPGINDSLLLLESPEAARLCSEMPRLPRSETAAYAFEDETGAYQTSVSKRIKLKPVMVNGKNIFRQKEPNERDCDMNYVDCRVEGNGSHRNEVGLHGLLDKATKHSRLPALQSYTSSRVISRAPIRRDPFVGVCVNTSVAVEHVMLLLEAALTANQIPGLMGHQEDLKNNGAVSIPGLCVNSNGGSVENTGNRGINALQRNARGASSSTDNADTTDNTDETDPAKLTSMLPFSFDLVTIKWAVDVAQRQYYENLDADLEEFNNALASDSRLGEEILEEDMPQKPLACMGYPISLTKPEASNRKQKDQRLIQLLSVPMRKEKASDCEVVELSDSCGQEATQYSIMNTEVGVSLGRKPTDGDIVAYAMDRVGPTYTYDVKGDLHSYCTWQEFAVQSSVQRGNCLEEDDPALDAILDTELMLLCRMQERRAQIEENPESHYNLDLPWPQTYSAVIKKAAEEQMNGSRRRKRSSRPTPQTGMQRRQSKSNNKYADMRASSSSAAASSACLSPAAQRQRVVMVDMRDV